MNVIVCYKWVLDEADVQIRPDHSVDFGRAKSKISDYDRNAIEAAMQCAGAGDTVVALTYGTTTVQKSVKDVLSRGPAQACYVSDESARTADGAATAKVLAAAIRKIGAVKLVVCAEGASDTYAHEVGPRIGVLLGLPVVSNASALTIDGDLLTATRVLNDAVETVRVALPAVVTVLPQAAAAPIPGLKAVLAAGKKPVKELTLAGLGLQAAGLAPKNAVTCDQGYAMSRKNVIFKEGEVADQVRQLVDSLVKEGVLA